MRRSRRFIAAPLTILVVGSLFAVWGGPSGAATGPPIPSLAAKPKRVLSPRLSTLARPANLGASANVQADAVGLPAEGPGSLLRRSSGRVLVNARLTSTTPRALAALRDAGAEIVAVGAEAAIAAVAVAPADLPRLAAVDGVTRVSEVLTPEVGNGPLRFRGEPLVGTSATCPSGLVSEGDTQLRAAQARSTYAVNGAGVRVGVLSDSYNVLSGAASDVAAGELPGTANPCGHTTPVTVQSEIDAPGDGSDEGRAMAQIVHDLAPGSPITVASAFNGDVDFANQILFLQGSGSKVIVDDITYYNEPMFQDGIIAKAVIDVTAAGAVYYSSAANSNAIVGGKNIGSYEAPSYRPTACPASVASRVLDCHDFNPGAGVDNGDTLTVQSGNEVFFSFGWSQPQYGISTDYDVFLIDQSTGSIVASAADDNIASDEAFEILSHQNASGVTKNYQLVVGRFAGTAAPRFKFIFHRANFDAVEWNTSSGGDIIGPTTFGHNASRFGGSIAATPWYDATDIETYSSRGPALYCWGPVVGTSPAGPLAPCVPKPIDFSATDGVRNSFFGGIEGGFHRFYGTSAAAPHAAAIAALQRQEHPTRTPAEVLAAQRAAGRPLAGFGVDAAGTGLIDAEDAIANLITAPSAPGTPNVTAAGATSAALSWAVPASNGGQPITSYRVLVYAGPSGTLTQTLDTGATATTRTVTGLTAGMLYRFKVAATNSIGTGAASAFSAHALPPFRTLDLFTSRQFTDFAGRAPTSAELASWRSALVAGSATATERVGAATVFAYWGPKVDPVTRLFYAFFQRPPDGGGLGYWSGRLRTGMTLSQVSASFAGSSEFQNTYGPLSNLEFVNLVYENALGRPGDSSGVAYWTDQLDRGVKTRGFVMVQFSEGSEHKGLRAGEVNTVDVFYGMLRRVPNGSELATWVPQSTTSKSAVITFLLGSFSYDARV